MNTRRRTLLHIGEAAVHSLLQTWEAWRQDAAPEDRLTLLAITPHPPDPQTLQLALQPPPDTHNLHRLAFDAGRVHLLLAVGSAWQWLPELQAQVDEIQLDAPDFSADPRRGPLRLCKALARLAAPDARLRWSNAAIDLLPALRSAGFEPQADGEGLYRPRFEPRRRHRPVAPSQDAHALIVGAGLAGCAMAWALAEQGWRSTLLDRADAPATAASGNPAGVFHGVVHAQDGSHARLHRAAALLAQRVVGQALSGGTVRGSAQGLLRLEPRGLQHMQAEIEALRLPADYVQALDADAASAACGLPLPHPAWFYPGGGWVQPAALARWFLQSAGAAAAFSGARHVQTLEATTSGWLLRDADGAPIAEAGTVVLANAMDALRLLPARHWPLQVHRGQISIAAAAGVTLPRLPLAGAGYLLPAIDGQAVFGASSHADDGEALPRATDHAFNLQRLQQLSPYTQGLDLHRLQGRVGWRCVADDRLPLVGAAPCTDVACAGFERLSEVPRRAGLYLFTALGSRGIGWSALGAQLLAAQISGAPWPLENSLAAALDPARFDLRAARRSA